MTRQPGRFDGQGGAAAREGAEARPVDGRQVDEPLAARVGFDMGGAHNGETSQRPQIDRLPLEAANDARGVNHKFHSGASWLGTKTEIGQDHRRSYDPRRRMFRRGRFSISASRLDSMRTNSLATRVRSALLSRSCCGGTPATVSRACSTSSSISIAGAADMESPREKYSRQGNPLGSLNTGDER